MVGGRGGSEGPYRLEIVAGDDILILDTAAAVAAAEILLLGAREIEEVAGAAAGRGGEP